MRFLLMLADVETQQLRPGDPGFAERIAAYQAFTARVQNEGLLVASERLAPTNRARTVRVREKKVAITDGPFAETKEQLGGFYLLECRDLAHALELAALIPTAQHGSVEVRPLFG